jgi:hypothetical protein
LEIRIKLAIAVGCRDLLITHLQRSSTADHPHSLDFTLGKLLHSIVGDIGRAESFNIGKQDPGNIEGNIALSDHHGFFPGQIWIKIPVLGQAIVPPDECPGRVNTAGGFLPRNAEFFILGRAVCEEDSVIMWFEGG